MSAAKPESVAGRTRDARRAAAATVAAAAAAPSVAAAASSHTPTAAALPPPHRAVKQRSTKEKNDRDARGGGDAAASAAAAADPVAPLTAASSSPTVQSPSAADELTAVKRRIADVEKEIKKATDKRDAHAEGTDLWKEYHGELKQLRDELMQLRDELKRMDLDRAVHTRLLTHGFPALSVAALVNSPSSTPAGSGKHEPATIIIRELALLTASEFQAQPVLASQIWAAAAAHDPDQLAWSTESDVQGYVKQALSDCLVSGGLQRRLRLSNELSVDDQRPDVWVLHLGKAEGAALTLPVGVGEVKKPKRHSRAARAAVAPTVLPDMASLTLQPPPPAVPAASSSSRSPRLAAKAAAAPTPAAADSAQGLDKPTLLGQIFDYMCMLRTQYGLRYVFGIVTNYIEWRIVWLPDTEPAAQATELPFRDVQPADPNTPLRRELHGTRILACDDPLLIQQLVSMLHKMAHSPHEPPAQLVDAVRPRWCVSEAPPYQWVHLKSDFTLQLSKAVHANSARFLLLQDYRGGADGRVWLVAAESSGALGVIKFPRRHLANRQLLEDETQLWRIIWRTPVARVVILAGEAALLMPFAFHAHPHVDGSYRFLKPDHLHPDQPTSYLSDVKPSDVDKLIAEANANPMAVAQEAICAMAEAQYEHEDVHWRHVAFLLHQDPKTNKLKRQAVLIDLGRVKRLPSTTPSDKAAAVARMLAALD